MNDIKLVPTNFKGITPNFLGTVAVVLGVILLFLIIYYLINIGNSHIERSKRIGIDLKFVIKIFGCLVLMYIASIILKKYPIIQDTLWSMFVAIIIAFIINPIVSYLETKNISRNIGVIIVYVTAAFLFGILIVTVIPKTITEISRLLTSIPEIVNSLASSFTDMAEKFNKITNNNFYGIDTGKIIDNLTTSINSGIQILQSELFASLRSIALGLSTVFSKILKFILVFIFSFYFTVDRDKFKNIILKNLPTKYKSDILFVSRRINQALLDFVKGRLLMAIFVGFFTMIYLLVLRVDFAIVIGLITCVADIIPYIGPFLGFLPAVLFAFMDAPIKALWVAILFILLQWAENNIIAPKLLSDKTGLNPMLILISIIIGGGVFGVFGMILSVPFASILIILIEFFKMKYNEKNRNLLD